MSWLGLVDDVIKVALSNGDDVVKILATRTGNSFGDELIKGLNSQRLIGKAVNKAELARLDSALVKNLGRRLKGSGDAATGNALLEAAQRSPRLETPEILDQAIEAAKRNKTGEGVGGFIGRNLIGRPVNRAIAAGPGVWEMSKEAAIGSAVFGLPMLGLSMLGSGSSNQIPQLTQEQLAMLTPEELAQYEAMLMQQEY